MTIAPPSPGTAMSNGDDPEAEPVEDPIPVDEAPRREFLELLNSDHHRVVACMMWSGASLHDAEDATQEAFVQGWRRVLDGRWYEIRDPRAWLRRVALNHYRGQTRQHIAVGEMSDRATPGPDHAELTDQCLDIAAALRRLDPQARTVMAFRFDGISTSSIAVELGISDQRVRDLLKRARQTLKRLHLPASSEETRAAESDLW